MTEFARQLVARLVIGLLISCAFQIVAKWVLPHLVARVCINQCNILLDLPARIKRLEESRDRAAKQHQPEPDNTRTR